MFCVKSSCLPKRATASGEGAHVSRGGSTPNSFGWIGRSLMLSFQRVRRSRGIEKWVTRPSGCQSWEISPPRPDHVNGAGKFQVARGKPRGQLPHTLSAKTERNS
jgi:hypothetical protein